MESAFWRPLSISLSKPMLMSIQNMGWVKIMDSIDKRSFPSLFDEGVEILEPMDLKNEINFVVGAERRLADVLDEAQIMPLLKSAVKAGIGLAAIVNDKEVPLWTWGNCPQSLGVVSESWDASHPLLLEGEPVGTVRFMRGMVNPKGGQILADLIGETLNNIMANNLKRMLTTEIHTQIVNQSYEELLESNRQLAESEKKYRDLAENLEIRVQERTEELKRAYVQLMHQEKMASIGQLAAGVAHEINNPLGFVLSNLCTLRTYLGRITDMLKHFRALDPSAGAEKWRELKLDFIVEDVDALLEQSVSGAERVKKIVADLKGFSHVDETGSGGLDVNQEIDRTLSVLAHEIPQDAKLVKKFGDLPSCQGKGALLGTVFLNLIRNALQASPKGLELVISTDFKDDIIQVAFADNGPGVEENILNRIFEPFFTTRDVGQGTGLGLTVAYDIVKGFGGTIEVANREEGGAIVLIQLPVTGSCHGQVR
jgi:signal transduction histidine kinase